MRAVITGSSKGIGKAVAIKLVMEGYEVAVCSSNKTNIYELREELLSIAPGAKVLASVCDISSKQDVINFAEEIKAQWQSIDVLVNNAGIFLPDNILEAEEGRLEYILNLNFFSAYHLTRSLQDQLYKSPKSHIFNICSVASLQAYASGSLYTISKHALLGFSRSLREEMKTKRVRVTSLFPGATFTDSWKGTEMPQERFMKAEDVAEMIWCIYNLSDRAVVEEILLRPLEGDI